jgi:tetratricopeptide (TPR) repeat protein
MTMMSLHKTPTLRRTLFGAAILILLTVMSFVGYAQQQPIPAEKAKMMGYVEDFWMNNGRDITMRKSLEWGDVITNDKGNSTIRYQFLALIWDKDRKILCLDFTFDKDGKYVSAQKVEGFPKDVVVEKPDAQSSSNAAALSGLGWAAWREGKKDDAIEYWKEAIGAGKNVTAASSGLAQAYEEKGNKATAAQYYKIWLDAEPDNKDAQKGLEKNK